MRYSDLRSREFRRLRDSLQQAEPTVAGYLLYLEDFLCREYPDGCIPLSDVSRADIEYECRWSGPPGELAGALAMSGHLVEQDNCLIYRGWKHKAPEYLKKRVRRAQKDETPPSNQRRLPYGEADPTNSDRPAKTTSVSGHVRPCPPLSVRRETKRNETESEALSDSDSETRAGDSDSVSSEGHVGVRNAAYFHLRELLRFAPPAVLDCKTAAGKQARSDKTTLAKLIAYNIRAPDADNARGQAKVLEALAREAVRTCGQFRPMARLIVLARERNLMYPVETVRMQV